MNQEAENTTDQQGDLMLWIAAGAVAAIAVGWLAVTNLGGDSGSAPTVSGTNAAAASASADSEATSGAGAADPAGDTIGPAGPMAVLDTNPLSDPALDNPLRAAEMALEAGMLVEPEDYSAWSLFAAALATDPNDQTARDGLERVALALIDRGETAVEQGRYDDARESITRILARLPDFPGALALLDTIETTEERAAAERSARAAAAAITPVRTQAPPTPNNAIAPPDVTNEDSAEPAGPTDEERLIALQAEFEEAFERNRLLAPQGQSAKHFVTEMRSLDATDERTESAVSWLTTEMLGRSQQSAEASDWAAAETWLDEAEALGAPIASLVEHRTTLVNFRAQAEADRRRPVSELEVVEYVPPEYPYTALSRGIEGWVDLDFRVTSAGTTVDISVTDSSHEQMFQNEAIAAVERWRFAPVTHMGIAVNQRTYARVRFVVER